MVTPSNNTDKTPSIDQAKAFEDKRKKCDRDNKIKAIVACIFAIISFFAILCIPVLFPAILIPAPKIISLLTLATASVIAIIFLRVMWFNLLVKYSNPKNVNYILDTLKKDSLDEISKKTWYRSLQPTDLHKCGIINAKAKKEMKTTVKEWDKNREKLNSYNFYITVIEFFKGHDSKLHKYILKNVDITVTKNQELENKWEDLRVKEIIPNLPAPLEIPIKS